MALPTKIVVIGAGSASFGLNSLAALIGSPRLRGSTLALVDRQEEALHRVYLLAQRLNRDWDAQMSISTHAHHAEALPGAAYVILSIEVAPREGLWRSDFEITLKYGVRQPYAENGGPGGFAHAARNTGPVMEIVGDMETVCPEAWLINYTNPMMRICDAITRYSAIKVVGLCHQIQAGYAMVGLTLAEELGIEVPPGFTDTHAGPASIPSRGAVARQAMQKIHIVAAGLNHFTWMLSVHDKRSGADLYPLFAEKWAEGDPNFEPLTRRVYEAFGRFPIPGDEHLCEYLPWLSDPLTRPWGKYEISLYDWDYWTNKRGLGHDDIAHMAAGEMTIDGLRHADSEGALEMITNLAGGTNHSHIAVNLPNQGYIPNLPYGAIVEVPGVVNGFGVCGVGVGELPEGIAELCRREIAVTQLGVDAAVLGDRQAALQCLLLSPGITDMDVARQILEDYLLTYREFLPQFWE
jgi:alpha-galactosidase